mmetsp:Transcript_23373/g.44351  ORF Transcript_23373/g.44351 Transcript_23373/m.44351 type:complete len:137 (-) Transcript_23373:33-443(-)
MDVDDRVYDFLMVASELGGDDGDNDDDDDGAEDAVVEEEDDDAIDRDGRSRLVDGMMLLYYMRAFYGHVASMMYAALSCRDCVALIVEACTILLTSFLISDASASSHVHHYSYIIATILIAIIVRILRLSDKIENT